MAFVHHSVIAYSQPAAAAAIVSNQPSRIASVVVMAEKLNREEIPPCQAVVPIISFHPLMAVGVSEIQEKLKRK